MGWLLFLICFFTFSGFTICFFMKFFRSIISYFHIESGCDSYVFKFSALLFINTAKFWKVTTFFWFFFFLWGTNYYSWRKIEFKKVFLMMTPSSVSYFELQSLVHAFSFFPKRILSYHTNCFKKLDLISKSCLRLLRYSRVLYRDHLYFLIR